MQTDASDRQTRACNGLSQEHLPVASKLKSLGVTIDFNLRFDCHARNVAKACNLHTRHVRSLLTDDVAQTVACSGSVTIWSA